MTDTTWSKESPSRRARQLDVTPGVLPPGPFNTITDVTGVGVGHLTYREEPDICTGATAILPHGGNLFGDRVPAGLAVGNGFGKLAGGSQVLELGELESPIVLTNTLAVPQALEAVTAWVLDYPGNESVTSVNGFVGETNDGYLNNIRRRSLSPTLIRRAIEEASAGTVAEGAVGAGTGTVCFGWKGGIGTSSRCLPESLSGCTVGVLVQSNFGGSLQVAGVPVGRELGHDVLQDAAATKQADGSIMIIIATDAPLSDRNLRRLAARAFAGLARTGASMATGSGDYALAFSTSAEVRRLRRDSNGLRSTTELPNDMMSPLFQAVIEATEEAIYNSLFMAATTRGYRARLVEAVPLHQLERLLYQYGRR